MRRVLAAQSRLSVWLAGKAPITTTFKVSSEVVGKSWPAKRAPGEPFKKPVFRGVYNADVASYRHGAAPHGDIR